MVMLRCWFMVLMSPTARSPVRSDWVRRWPPLLKCCHPWTAVSADSLNRSDSYVAAVFPAIAGCLPSRFAPECLHGIVTLLRAESHDCAALVEGNRSVLAPVIHSSYTDLVPRGHLVACLQ